MSHDIMLDFWTGANFCCPDLLEKGFRQGVVRFTVQHQCFVWLSKKEQTQILLNDCPYCNRMILFTYSKSASILRDFEKKWAHIPIRFIDDEKLSFHVDFFDKITNYVNKNKVY